MTRHRIVGAGDSVLVVEFEDRIDPDVNAHAISVAAVLDAARIPGVRDVVPTYRSVAVYFDPRKTDYDALYDRIDAEAGRERPAASEMSRPIRIPVLYGGDGGPDLGAVAAFARLSEAEVVQLHTATTYRVFMLGFVAGFAYMGTVDPRIAMPRQTTPRVKVPLGTVAIAGVQTGIYPATTPGGWQLIGRTPLKPFDPARTEPFLLKAGDAVQFFAIDGVEFERLSG